jgi:hypothetical protein
MFKLGQNVVFTGYKDGSPDADMLHGEVGTVTNVDLNTDEELAMPYPYNVSFKALSGAGSDGSYLFREDELQAAPEGAELGDVLAEVE